jgi:glycosyltransferase involved in cell wall biosynthesis
VTIIVYSETTAQNIETRLGKSEYSYYFVLKEFLPALRAIDTVVTVSNPAVEVDPIYRACKERGENCVFLSFTPPHLTELDLECPTIPVFAWEFDTIPSETWYGEREQDWRYALDKLGKAITHSSATVRTLKNAMGADFPVASIPAPVWDRYASLYDPLASPVAKGTRLELIGTVIDSTTFDFSTFAGAKWHAKGKPPELPIEENRKKETTIDLDGVVYLTVFNPGDGRKNWHDLAAAFCWTFRNCQDATLILKLTSHELALPLAWMLEYINRLTPFQCRLLLLTGFMQSDQYEALIRSASYIANSSHGEGQCLPLMEGMARGKAVIAPHHTGMSDYIHPDNAFVVRSSAAPTLWPHDPRIAFRTLHQRIDFDSLVGAYRESYAVAKTDPARYRRMGEQAREWMRRHASVAVVEERLRSFLWSPARPAGPDDRYGRVGTRPLRSLTIQS